MLRAIYSCIESALLWYKLLSTTLEGLGFDINHYDRCVENKIIEDKNKLLPGMWRTKNYHIKHRSNIRQIEQIPKKIGYLSDVIGNKQNFLVMNIEVRDNIIQVDMVEQLEE